MSGGFFDYQQYKIKYLAENIEDLVKELNEEDRHIYLKRKQELQKYLEEAIFMLEKAYLIVNNVDYLMADDTSEASCLSRIEKDLKEINIKNSLHKV